MNFKLATILLLASYALAIPQPPAHRLATSSLPTEISPQLLQTFQRNVLYSGAASCDILDTWDCTACKQTLVKSTEFYTQFSNSIAAAHGYVAVNHEEGQIIVAFRGSGDIFAYIEDAVIFLKDFDVAGNGAKVHTGFYNVWNAARDLVHDPVSQLLAKYPDYYLNIVGHSLGAAVASMAALELAITYPNRKVTVMGVSQPRMGNKAFALAVAYQPNLTAYRLEQANDFVGQYPAHWLGYVHNSPEYWIKTAFTEDVVYCPSAPGEESQLCSNSVSAKFSSDVHNFVLGYHFDGGCNTSSSQTPPSPQQ